MNGTTMLSIIFTALCAASLLLGVNEMTLADLARFDHHSWLTLTASRLPRLIALVLSGAGLAISGVIMQQVVRNRFVEPATSGGLEAAKLGILMGLLLLPDQGPMIQMLLAMFFCFAACLIYVQLITRMAPRNVVVVPVVGLMYGGVLGAIAEFWAYSHNILQSMQGWMLGDFSKIVQGNYEIVLLILPAVVMSYVFAHRFTLMGMGEDIATSLGLGWHGTVALSLLIVSATVSVTVIAVGTISFVGLVVPNLVAMWKGDNLARTLPIVALGGAVLLLACDLVGRFVIWPYEVPIGLTVGSIGGIIFLGLIIRRMA